MINEKIREKLISLQDLKYRDFSASLIPTVDKNTVIGVRMPALRSYAKELLSEARSDASLLSLEDFLSELPHKYFEENNLHAFIISDVADFERCIIEVERFLPFIDNWATCDSFRPRCFAKHREKLLPYIEKWLDSGKTYTVRFAIELLMIYFLDEYYIEYYPELVSKIRSDEYYVNMMIAWYFATALAKQYDSIIPYLEGHKLDVWVHNKAIRKAVESYRISDEQKKHLRILKSKNM